MTKADRDFSVILNDSMDALRLGISLEAILAQHPDEAEQLLPLLKTAQDITQTSDPKPPKGAKISSKAAMMEFLARQRKNSQQNKKIVIEDLGLGFQSERGRGWIVFLFSLVLAFILLSSLCVSMTETLPGRPLYPVKLALQDLHVMLTFNPQERIRRLKYYMWVRQQDLLAADEQGSLSEADVEATLTALPTPEAAKVPSR